MSVEFTKEEAATVPAGTHEGGHQGEGRGPMTHRKPIPVGHWI